MTEVAKVVVFASPYSSDDALKQRAHAVAAAMEIIHARAGASSQAPINLEYEFSKLSEYADKIQEALAKA